MYHDYYYIQTNIICIVILGIIVFGFFKKDIEKTSSITFKQMCIATILLCLSDLFAGILRGKLFTGAVYLIELSNVLYLELGVIIGYLWLKYVYQKTTTEKNSKERINVYRICLLIMTIFIFLNHWTHFFFKIDEANLYVRQNGTILYFLVTCCYLLIPTIKITKSIIKDQNLIVDKELVSMIMFVIPPTITNILQFLIYGLTLNQVGITISILVVFLNYQRNQIIKDELTGLSNRRELNRYLNSLVIDNKSNDLINLLMIDANHFKEINDKYGHIMGDKALIEIANSLKIACNSIKDDLFISRYGGDEFFIIGTNLDKDMIKNIEQAINSELIKINDSKVNPYLLEVSIGNVSEYKDNIKSIGNFIAKADKKMYLKKQRMHALKK